MVLVAVTVMKSVSVFVSVDVAVERMVFDETTVDVKVCSTVLV